MKKVVFIVLATLLVAGPVLAQDSVSKLQGAAGSDAVSPYDTTEQINNYVVDLAPLSTSWGTKFGIAPIAKSSLTDPGSFFSSLLTAQGMSRTLGARQPFVRNSYALWNGQGFGINGNGAIHDAPATVSTLGLRGSQFAASFAEFGGNANNIISAVVNYVPSRPNRLYVSRVAAAVNGFNTGENRAQVGNGAIDWRGFAHFRADNFGASGPNTIVGNNIFRIDSAGRAAGTVNVIDNAGGNDAAATDWLVVRSGTTQNTPSILPSATRPVLIGTNFNAEYVFESAPNVISTTTAHRAGTTDQRGNISFHDVPVFNNAAFANSIGTATMYGKDAGDLTRRIIMWGVDSNGAVTGTGFIEPPATITDNDNGFVFPNGETIDEFIYHVSQVAFRGGNGQVAIGHDARGNVLVSTIVTGNGLAPSDDNPVGAVAVARFNASDIAGTIEWTTAAYNNFAGTGKEILDGPNGNAIGQVVELNAVTGGAPFGPSFSAPCFDAAGNLWFLAACEFYDRLPGGLSDFDTALLRAVYNPVTFSYQLEEVLEVGSVFHGQNSNTDYQIRFLGIADSGSVDSGTMWSGNAARGPLNGLNSGALATSDPRNLGGLVLSAEIVYDVNGDGDFVKVTGGGGDPLSEDQEYNVLLYVGPYSAWGTSTF